MANIPRINSVLDYIETNSNDTLRFDMGVFVAHRYGGTDMCFAGWALYHSHNSFATIPENEAVILREAAEYLGLTTDESFQLFIPYRPINTVAELRQLGISVLGNGVSE